MPACPACHDQATQPALSFTVSQVATLMVSPARSQARHDRLVVALRELWGGETVTMCACAGCGFVFADPYLAGTSAIYELYSGGAAFYPRNRFEFAPTIAALSAHPSRRLLEIGAGTGAFLRHAKSAGVVDEIVALEYNEGAVGQLRAIPNVTAFQGSVQEFVATAPGQFDAVCLYQVLEHLDRLDEVFDALRQLTTADARLFISVPNPPHTTAVERITKFLDVPPIHIGRWTTEAMTAISERHGLAVVDHQLDASHVRELWWLAKFRWEGRALDQRSLNARVNGFRYRPPRGAFKRGLAIWDLAMVLRHFGSIPPGTQWFHLRAT